VGSLIIGVLITLLSVTCVLLMQGGSTSWVVPREKVALRYPTEDGWHRINDPSSRPAARYSGEEMGLTYQSSRGVMGGW
jgi:hypothetical protein